MHKCSLVAALTKRVGEVWCENGKETGAERRPRPELGSEDIADIFESLDVGSLDRDFEETLYIGTIPIYKGESLEDRRTTGRARADAERRPYGATQKADPINFRHNWFLNSLFKRPEMTKISREAFPPRERFAH